MLSQKRGGFQLLEPSPFLKYLLDYKLSDEIDLIKVIVNYYSQNKNCQLYLALAKPFPKPLISIFNYS